MLKRVVAVVVPSLLLLSGCGVAGTEFHPGVAVQVGDESISTDEVDDLTSTFCDAIEDQVQQPVPLERYRSSIAALLGWRSAVDQLNEKYDVTPSADYLTQVTSYEGDADDLKLTGDEKDAFVEVQILQGYITDVLTQIGLIELKADGEADPTVDFQYARGNDELVAWIDREGVEFDPRYGFQMVDGVPTPVSADLSFAVGELATGAGKVDQTTGAADADYVAMLPANATCGG